MIYTPFYEARRLFSIATGAYERTRRSRGDRDPGQDDAFIAIVFAAAALEAFINEAADLAEQTASADPVGIPDPAAVFAGLVKDVERTHGPVELKYQLLSLVLRGRLYDRGSLPYQDLTLLFRVRNELLHLKPPGEPRPATGSTTGTSDPALLKSLRSKGITADEIGSGTPAPWTDRISTRSVARWACNVAADMVRSVADMAPGGSFGNLLRIAQFEGFQRVA